MTSQVALSLCGQGERVCVASFEMKPVVTLQRKARMFAGFNPFSPEFQGEQGLAAIDQLYEEFQGFTDKRLWLYDQMGTADAEKVGGMVRYCAKELGIKIRWGADWDMDGVARERGETDSPHFELA